MRLRNIGWRALGILMSLALVSGAMVASGGASGATTTNVKRGGNLTVLTVSTQWPNLDPALDAQDAADVNILDAIYGQLFEMGPNGTYVPDLATGYTYSNHNLRINITIRSHVKFSDGTPFTAQAVAASMNRVLTPSYGCICDANFKDVTSITAVGNQVQMNLTSPNATILESIIGEGPTWTVPPNALANESEATFEQAPFGAGPFMVQSNVPSSEIVLKANPNYWAKGEPYLGSLTYLSVSSDQSANYGLQSGEGQVVSGLSTPSIILGDKAQYRVQSVPGSANPAITFNPASAPFNNILAREAVIYATYPQQLLNALVPKFGALSQSEATPGDLFFEAKVTGYRTYNVTKAKALVQQLGGLSFSLVCNNPAIQTEICVALQSQLARAGINMTPLVGPLSTYLAAVRGKTYQAFLNYSGNFDPDVGVQGLASDYQTGGALSGYANPTLDGLINKSEAFVGNANRQKVFDQIYKYISDQAYADIIFSEDTAVVMAKNVVGLKMITGPARTLNFEAVSLK